MHSFVGQEVLVIQKEKVIEVSANLRFVLETYLHTEHAFFCRGVVEEIFGSVQSDNLVSTDIDAQLIIKYVTEVSAAILVHESGYGIPRSLIWL